MSTNSFLSTKPRNFKPTKINDFTVISFLLFGKFVPNLVFIFATKYVELESECHFFSENQNVRIL